MSQSPQTSQGSRCRWALASVAALSLAWAAGAAWAGSGRLSPAQIAEGPSRLGLWRVALPYGSEGGPDLAGQERQGFAEVGALLDLTDRLRDSLAAQPEVLAQLYELRRELLALDLDRIFEDHPLFFTGPGGERLMRVRGQWEQGRYRFAVGDVPPLAGGGGRLGNLAAELGFRRNPYDPDLVRLRTRATADLGTLLYREMLESWEVFNRLLTLERVHQESWLGHVRLPTEGLGRRLDLNDLEIVSEWMASFPHLAAVLSRVSSIEDVINPARRPQPGGPDQVRLLLRFRRDRLKDLYPEDFKTLGFFLDHLTLRTDFLTEAGTYLARMAYRAQGHKLDVSYLTQEGGFAITDAQGYAVGPLVRPTEAGELRYTAMTDIQLDLYGLRISLEDLPLTCHYQGPGDWEAPERHSRFVVQMNRPPRVRIEGALLYILPTWLLDALIPGTLEDLFNAFFGLLTGGNGGRGVVMELRFDEAGGRHRIEGDLSLELPYRLLGPFVQEVIGREWADLPSKKERPKRLLSDLRGALRADFERVRKQAQGPPALVEPGGSGTVEGR